MSKLSQIYHSTPKLCMHCNLSLPYVKRYNKFCGSSCAATYNNLHSSPDRKRGPTPSVVGTTKNERDREKARLKRWTINIAGPYSKIYANSCSTCGKVSLQSSYKKFCNEHSDNYSHAQRAKYWFTFSLSDYPDLFDFTLLRNYGMRSASNPYGVVRDHRVSVADSIKHNYDPYYIKHPINCELMLHTDNCKKYTHSSISYTQLKQLVDEYELSKFGALTRN
jgi:hypothetical protein